MARSSGPMERAGVSISAPEVLRPLRRDLFMVTHLPANGARSPLNSTGSMTTIRSICVWCRIDRILCSCWSDDRKIVRQPESFRTNAVCSGGERGIERDGDCAEQQAGHIGDGPFGPILAEDGDAISGSNAPGMQRARGSGDACAEFARGDWQPLPGIAVQHHAVKIAFDRGEENVVQSGDAHCVFRVPAAEPRLAWSQSAPNRTLLFCRWFGQCVPSHSLGTLRFTVRDPAGYARPSLHQWSLPWEEFNA